MRLISFIKEKPRKGTETYDIGTSEFNFSVYKRKTPKGDGNEIATDRQVAKEMFIKEKPRKGTETLSLRNTIIEQTFIKEKPRKGTETVYRFRVSIRRLTVYKRKTPKGDGNLFYKALLLTSLWKSRL